ncbi:MAG: hypothetical protein QM784_25520 [Polyangiaceae bacterium]
MWPDVIELAKRGRLGQGRQSNVSAPGGSSTGCRGCQVEIDDRRVITLSLLRWCHADSGAPHSGAREKRRPIAVLPPHIDARADQN